MVNQEPADALDGEVIAHLGGNQVLVRLVDGREVPAVINRKVARDAYFVVEGDRVKIVFRQEPKRARIVELRHAAK